MGESLVSTEEPLPDRIPSALITPLLYPEISIGDPFMSYISDCAQDLIERPELHLQVIDIQNANARLQRIVERFQIPTDATYLPPQYQFQIASLSLALAHLVPNEEEHNFENPHIQAIEKLLRSAAQHEAITEDIDHLVVAVTVIDGLPEDLQQSFAQERQEFINLYKSTRLHSKERHEAIKKVDAWLEMIRDRYGKDSVLRLQYKNRDMYDSAYKKICSDFGFTEAEVAANYASGMGLTNIQLAILCIEELTDNELVAHEKEHLYRNLSLFGLFGEATEEALVELESLKKLYNLRSIQDLRMDEFEVNVYYVREMRMLLQLHSADSKTYELLNKMSFVVDEETDPKNVQIRTADAENFSTRCIAHFGLEGLAVLYLAGIVPLDDTKDHEDLPAFIGREYGKIPTVDAQKRLQELFYTYSSNLRVM